MSILRTLATRSSILVLIGTALCAQSDVWTPRTVEKLKSVTAAQMSPDGAHVAYALSVPRIAGTDEDGAAWTEMHVLETADGRDRPFVTGKIDVGAFAWAPDGSSIAFLC